MRVLETEIEINASAERVWKILTDLERYPEGKGMVFKPTVLSAKENSELRWLGRLLFPGLFDGEHIFTISRNEGGCRLVQKEIFRGLLVPVMWGSLEKHTRAGFELMNTALKERAESVDIP